MAYLFQRLLPLIAAWLVLLAVAAAPLLGSQAADGPMIKVRLATGLVEGQPLTWSKRQVSLLSRDGQLIMFRTSGAQDYHRSAPRFVSYSASEIRSRLLAEFGRDYDVTGTGHYLVVHPSGGRDVWSRQFEDLYRSFYHYFKVRGFGLLEPKYPLVAVVFPSRDEYLRYARQAGMNILPSYLGHYSPVTNRIYLFETQSSGAASGKPAIASTIIHEATHQTAFNTGVHTRFAATPRWVTEGLATMFEAPGVWNSSRYRSAPDRLNRGRLARYQQHSKSRPEVWLQRMIESDDVFVRQTDQAYAEAWALSFYLCETRPRKYSQYLARVAARAPFEEYSNADRLADFTAVFGNNLKWLDSQYVRYMAKLR